MVSKLLIPGVIIVVFVAFILSQSVYSANVTPTPVPTPTAIPYHQINPKDDPIDVDKLWNLIQNWRVSVNLPEFIKDERLCTIAEKRAVEIQTVYSHAKFEKDYANYSYVLQENATTCTEAQMCLDKWLASLPHKVTLEKWTYSCVSCNNWYCAQIFSNFEK